MNIRNIIRMIGNILLIEAVFMVPAAIIALYDNTWHVFKAFLFTIVLLSLIAALVRIGIKHSDTSFYTRESFALVAIAWISVSFFGAIPIYASGEAGSFVNAFFESSSGFTGAGASVIVNITEISRASLYWRSFTNWLGGMGIIVFMLAIIPTGKADKGRMLGILRAETTGPAVEKIVPKIRTHATALYLIYMVLTVVCFIALFIAGMPLFDNFCITFGTVGTGGFAVRPDSMASYGTTSQIIVTVFMLLSGINFNIYYLMFAGHIKDALKNIEIKLYFAIMVIATAITTINISGQYSSLATAFKDSAFTVSSIITTAGFSTADFNLWPQLSKGILMALMIIGACAGSTGGGIKVARLCILIKYEICSLRRLIHPREVSLVKMNGKMVNENTLKGVFMYLTAYAGIFVISFLLISLDNFSFETNFTTVLACLSNIGPGMGAVGPYGSFSDFSGLSKLVLSADMLLGRLEIFPVLLLFHSKLWNRAA